MSKLRRINTPETDRLIGYLDAAQHIFIKGQYDVRLEASCFDIFDASITDEEVVLAVYSDLNPIEHRTECSLENMIATVHETLSLPRQMWTSDYCNVSQHSGKEPA